MAVHLSWHGRVQSLVRGGCGPQELGTLLSPSRQQHARVHTDAAEQPGEMLLRVEGGSVCP